MNKLTRKKGKTMKNEKGMVLVLAIFMLALLSMIGLSSMMTSTTDITIAGNEKFSKIVYYQSESALTMGGEVARLFYYPDNGTDLVTGFIDAAETINLIDTEFYIGPAFEKTDDNLWHKDDQSLDTLDPDDLNGTLFEPDLQLSGDLNVDVDIDKLYTRQAPGGGALYGRGDKGGRQFIHAYNVEALALLPANSSIRADHIMGYHINSFE
jgi:hypothetical protein